MIREDIFQLLLRSYIVFERNITDVDREVALFHAFAIPRIVLKEKKLKSTSYVIRFSDEEGVILEPYVGRRYPLSFYGIFFASLGSGYWDDRNVIGGKSGGSITHRGVREIRLIQVLFLRINLK